MPQTAAEHDFMPLEVLPEKPQDHFSTREWLAHLEETVLPAKPPARPRSAFVPTSFGQAVNLMQIGAGLGLSLLRRKPVAWGRPLLAMIEPTSLCNLKCPLCPSGNGSLTRERARLDFDTFKTIIDRLPDSIRMLQLWNQGEPFIVRELPEMIRYAKRRDVYIVTSTNGHYFRKDARRTEDGHYITQKRRFFADECLRLGFSVVINCDGRVSPCCFDKDGDHSLGNLLDEPFDAIWFGERYTRFREHLLRSRYDLNMCQDCTEGVKELFLQTVDYHQA